MFSANNKKPLITKRDRTVAIILGLFIPLMGVSACSFAVDRMIDTAGHQNVSESSAE